MRWAQTTVKFFPEQLTNKGMNSKDLVLKSNSGINNSHRDE